MLARVTSNIHKFYVEKSDCLYHIEHEANINDFVTMWRKPCEKCVKLFAPWRFEIEFKTGNFPEKDCEDFSQYINCDPVSGYQMFMCPNCGFCGTIAASKLYASVNKNAPTYIFDKDVGRNIQTLYKNICTKVNNNMDAKIAYLKSSYL
jgi:hypothetical protein